MAATARSHSTRSAGVRRLLSEASELSSDDSLDYTAAPLEDDLFTWHWTIRGAKGTDFAGGVYHGRMVLPPSYPFAPPEVYVATPSGRFEVNKKICLSISSFHPESWQPSWGVRTALLALVAFFDTEAQGAVGSLDAPPAERRRLATASHSFTCPTCAFSAKEFEAETQAKLVELEKKKALEQEQEAAQGGEAPIEAGVAKVDEEQVESDGSTVESSPVLIQRTSSPPRSRSHPRGPVGDGQDEPVGVSPAALFRSHPSPDALANLPSAGDPLPSPGLPPTQRVPTTSHTRTHVPGPAQQAGAPPPLVHVPTPAAPAPVAAPQQVVLVQAGLEGGSPLWIDRAIVVCLMGLLALIVRKVA